MFCASQNLLAGAYLPKDEAARARLKADDPAAHAARKEDTNNIFEDAIRVVGTSQPKEVLLYLSPLTAKWNAPPHAYLLQELGEPPTDWVRKGPGATTRAWCCACKPGSNIEGSRAVRLALAAFSSIDGRLCARRSTRANSC
jgi:hypothetical protein